MPRRSNPAEQPKKRKRPTKAFKRDEAVVNSFLRFLRERIAGFKNEPEEVQIGIAWLMWDCESKSREHETLSGYRSITHQELERRFGRNEFNAINERLGIFDRTPGWSIEKHQTKGTKLMPHVREMLREYLHKRRRGISYLVSMDARKIETLPAAISSKDSGGNTATAWAGIALPNRVPVDLGLLKRMKEELDTFLTIGSRSLFVEPEPEKVEATRDILAKIVAVASVDMPGRGYVAQRFRSVSSGRLYATGSSVNLQTVPRGIRMAALHGMWDYDLENCHFAIFKQMCERFGFRCCHIEHYLAHKEKVRHDLAQEVGISVEQVKTCLLAVMYGAPLSQSPHTSIPEEIGRDKAQRLYLNPTFKGIYTDIIEGREVILASWPDKRVKNLINDMGKAIRQAEQPRYLLAHLIQGAEARMLRVAMRRYPGEILLPMHDGWVASTRLDKELLEREIEANTGYRMEIRETHITLSPDWGLGE